MKKNLFMAVLVLLTFCGCFNKLARSGALDPSDEFMVSAKKYSDEIIDQLKGTTTIFFVKDKNSPATDSLKQTISEVWDLTPIQFENFEDFQKFGGDQQFSYFALEAITQSSDQGGFTTEFYVLRLFKDVSKKGKVNTTGLCRIELALDHFSGTGKVNFGKPDEIIARYYNRAIFYNWTPVLAKAQIGAVCTDLKNKIRRSILADYKSDRLSGLLAHDTLYVPKRFLFNFNNFTGNAREKKDNVFANYKYKYKYCSDDELYQIFEVEKRGRLLFEWVRGGANKIINIYDMKDREILYRNSVSFGPNLKAKDIDRIE